MADKLYKREPSMWIMRFLLVPVFLFPFALLSQQPNQDQATPDLADAWYSPLWGNADITQSADQITFTLGDNILFDFADGQSATFQSFAVVTSNRDSAKRSLKEFELLAGDSRIGPFQTIGKFQTQNMEGRQEVSFQAATAKFLLFVRFRRGETRKGLNIRFVRSSGLPDQGRSVKLGQKLRYYNLLG